MLKRVLRLTIKRRAPVAACPRRTSFLLCGKGADAFQKIRGVDTPYAGDIVIARQVIQELEK